VDEFTGRLMYGAAITDGIHRKPSRPRKASRYRGEDQTLATITFQNFPLGFSSILAA